MEAIRISRAATIRRTLLGRVALSPRVNRGPDVLDTLAGSSLRETKKPGMFT